MFFKIFIIGFILLILALILYYVKKEKIFEKFETKTVIPLHIYQTWHTKNLPPKMSECVNNIKKKIQNLLIIYMMTTVVANSSKKTLTIMY